MCRPHSAVPTSSAVDFHLQNFPSKVRCEPIPHDTKTCTKYIPCAWPCAMFTVRLPRCSCCPWMMIRYSTPLATMSCKAEDNHHFTTMYVYVQIMATAPHGGKLIRVKNESRNFITQCSKCYHHFSMHAVKNWTRKPDETRLNSSR